MGRVIRISTILMGVLLVGMTGGLKWVRGEERADILILWEGQSTPNRLSWLYPNAPRLTPFRTDMEQITIVDTSPSREWLYFMGGEEEDYSADIWNGSLYRVRVGGVPEVVVPYIDGRQITISPDHEWIVYPQLSQSPNDTNMIQFIRLELETAKKSLLRTIETLKDVRLITQVHLSGDQQWINFKMEYWDRMSLPKDYYRFRLDGTDLQPLTNTFYYSYIEVEGARLTIGNHEGYETLYWREPDGRLRPVTVDWRTSYFTQCEVEKWLPDQQILILNLDYGRGHWAVRPNDPNPVWTVSGTHDYLRIDSEHGWIMFQNWDDYTLWRMRLDGRELLQIVPAAVWWQDWSLDPSGNGVTYRVSQGEWRHVSIDGTQDELVYQSTGYPEYWGRSPQEQWFVFVDGNAASESAVFRTRLDGEIVQQLTPITSGIWMPYQQYRILWMTALVPRWNYLRMTFFGLGCMAFGGGSGVVWSYFRRRSGTHE